MADFVESAKNLVSSAVSRTSWQAQKQLRVHSKQSEIDQLIEQRNQLLDELAKVALTLFEKGRLTDTQLSRICSSIQELDHDMQNRESQLQQIKAEAYNPSQFGPSPTVDYTPPPVTPTPNPTPAYTPPSPQPGARPTAGAQPKSLTCPNCGSTIRPNALYCRSCGAKLR